MLKVTLKDALIMEKLTMLITYTIGNLLKLAKWEKFVLA